MPHIKTSQTNRLSKTFLDTKSQKCGLRCTVFSVDGNEYTGEWLNNKKHGKGTQVWKKSGAIYTGEWKFGKRDGYGTLSVLLPETKEYEKKYCGGWENGKKHGFGLQFYKNAAVYEGGWIEGQRGVWGRMCYESGDVYEGEWLMDKTHGQGTIRFANGNWYEGAWREGEKNGNGKFYYSDKGQILEGFWVDGVAKCGTLSDFQRSEAPTPTKYSIPQLQLMDMDLVLSEAKSAYLETLSSKFPLARDKLAKKE
ncbi:MORN repeat-containing protein 3 isoform X1 [Gasterosteus aculeatus]|uniref:MORN repeat-containing protein 3 n=1 Tax=Gasterosteus aculeatus aculeatus TaxID=481459 RepID=G3PXY8_GASAC|nr:MORN repeat-containing protein 3 isoform X1 [Gasterosteus aculeatus aculeatus]XP_040054127.1 MORN repeat-containing protein 3 isoform X1 [Gasterosteus aculeatus aculeatus]